MQPYAEQMRETDYKQCRRDMYGQEVCDEYVKKYMTEEPSREWEQMQPQSRPAAYPQDMSP